MEQKYASIPKEKFRFARKENFGHDEKFDTKPVGYFRDAFRRFCKNKGSVVAGCIIIILFLFAIITPLCTQYTVSFSDSRYAFALPKNELFADTDFWDGCSLKQGNQQTFIYYYAMGEETGHNAIKNQEYEIISANETDEDLLGGNATSGTFYEYRLDSYHQVGNIYMTLSADQYKAIQAYQDEYNIQVIYPTVALADRPSATQNSNDANYYYLTRTTGSRTEAILDENGNVQPVYWTCEDNSGSTDDYTSKMRIEGENGLVDEDGNTYYYRYARKVQNGYECRVNYYEYFIYNHTQVLKDGITEPTFLLGANEVGRDILTCLASGAQFSFLFAIAVCAVNMIFGAIYGAIEGYYGGVPDLVMERVSDILAAVPSVIIITLLQLHMGASSPMIILFIAFFMTGWIGTASTVRMQFYRFKNQEYILAARTLGARDRRIMFKHIFPNALGTFVTGSVLAIPSMIYSETNLSYLGIINLSANGVSSVGTLLAGGQPYITTFPHIILFPSIFIALLMLSFNLFGNGLRDAFNPSLRGSED